MSNGKNRRLLPEAESHRDFPSSARTRASSFARRVSVSATDFSAAASHELSVLSAAIIEVMTITIRAFVEDDVDLALKVEPLEELIDDEVDLCVEVGEEAVKIGRRAVEAAVQDAQAGQVDRRE